MRRVSHGDPVPCGDRNPQGNPQQPPPARARNTKRGLRSPTATETRKDDRSRRRWVCRQQHRQHCRSKSAGSPRPRKGVQEPDTNSAPKLTACRQIRIATINVRGLKQPGKREEIERWMKKESIDITILQETHTGGNSKEKRKDYTWYLNGTEGAVREYAGMAIIHHNHLGKYIEDIIPHDHRT